MKSFNWQVVPKRYILLSPILLYLSMAGVFAASVQWFGKLAGYILGFLSYWLIFGLLAPAILVGRGNFASLLKDTVPLFQRPNWLAGLLWIIIVGVMLIMYGREFISAPLALFLMGIPLATINGFCEELFWRGVFVKAFPENPWLGIAYPAIAFALWHLIPQSIFPAPNVPGFILSTFFLGLAYGFIAYRTGSAKWTAISHSLGGILALGGMLAPTVLKLLGV